MASFPGYSTVSGTKFQIHYNITITLTQPPSWTYLSWVSYDNHHKSITVHYALFLPPATSFC